MSCLEVIKVVAKSSINTEYAQQITPRFSQQFTEEMNRLNNEDKNVLKARTETLKAWKEMEKFAQDQMNA